MLNHETVDGDDHIFLREDGEIALWDMIQESLKEAGWILSRTIQNYA